MRPTSRRRLRSGPLLYPEGYFPAFLAATAAIQSLRMRRYDFVLAFLQGALAPGEQILCHSPPGYETLADDGSRKVWRVLRPIYGMQQGGRCWQRSLFPWIRSLGFNQCEADNCVFSMTTWGATSTTSSSSTSKAAPTRYIRLLHARARTTLGSGG